MGLVLDLSLDAILFALFLPRANYWLFKTSFADGMTMPTPRRLIPSLALLSAFEAASRTGSITLAAKELSLTQSAVSRQIKQLEEQLQVELFVRERQTIRLTPAGETYAREIRDALTKISSASSNLRANPHGGALNLAILPTFGTRWLAPRLPRFLSASPGVTINLVTRLSYFDFGSEPIDAAIHFGLPVWPGGEMTLLMSEEVVPVCNQDLKDKYGFATPEDVLHAPLLHITSRPNAWKQWLSVNGVADSGVPGMLFDQFGTLAQATIAGLGVALMPRFLIEEELSAGKLVLALERPMESDEQYYLVWPSIRGSYPPLVAFRDWLLAEIAQDGSQANQS
jgi:LysR family glycine cleavage system transcriptional activator